MCPNRFLKGPPHIRGCSYVMGSKDDTSRLAGVASPRLQERGRPDAGPFPQGPCTLRGCFLPSSSTVSGAALSCLPPPSSSSWGPQGRPRVRAGIRKISQSSSFKTYLSGPLPPHLRPPLPPHPGLQSSVSCPGTQGLVPDLPRDWVDISFLNLLSHLQNRSLVPAGGVAL